MQPDSPSTDQPQSGLNLSLADIYFILFRYKWVIAACAFIGLIAAAVVRFTSPTTYRSEAKLFVRYVLEEKRLADVAEDSRANTREATGGSFMASELEMLTSLDLTAQVADAIGPEKILAAYGGGSNRLDAAGVILSGITVDVPKGSTVIRLMCKHPDPALAQTITSNVIENYLRKHAQVHRELGALDNFLSSQSDIYRTRLNATEDQLKALRTKAGGAGAGELSKVVAGQIGDLMHQIYRAETELALRERSAVGQAEPGAGSGEARETDVAPNQVGRDAQPGEAPEVGRNAQPAEVPTEEERRRLPFTPPQNPALAASSTSAPATPAIPEDEVKSYKRLLTQLESVQNRLDDALLRLKPEHAEVISLRESVAQLQKRQTDLDARFPGIADRASALPATSISPSSTAAVPQLASSEELRHRIHILTNQLAKLRMEAASLDEIETDIQKYERQRDLQAAQLSNYVSTVERSRLQESMGPGRVSNISIVQSPSPAIVDASKRKKTMLMAGGGGIGAGIALAFLLELFILPTFKRNVDIERKLKLPLFLTMPLVPRGPLKHGSRRTEKAATGTTEDRGPRVRRSSESEGGRTDSDQTQGAKTAAFSPQPSALKNEDSLVQSTNNGLPPWDPSHELREHYEALRDRLILYFESNNMTHKPKMVAVTGCNPGAGTTTLAAGLAAVLSETGEGNVLLVDMNTGQGAAHPFFHGKPALGIFETVSPDRREIGQLQDNLFMASLDQSQTNGRVHPIRTSKYLDLMPKLKASDFDYIVFDLPAVSQTSLATRLAGFMDKILLVVEAEKTTPDAAKRAVAMLSTSHDRISAVLNKTRRYLPQWLDSSAD